MLNVQPHVLVALLFCSSPGLMNMLYQPPLQIFLLPEKSSILKLYQQQPGNDSSSNTSSQFVIPPPKSPPYLLKRTVFDTHPVLQGQRRYFFQETYARQEDMTTKSLQTQANELKQLEQQERFARINNNNTILTAKK